MRPQSDTRRRFLQSALPAGALTVAAAAGLLKPTAAWAWLPFFNFNQPAKPTAPASPAPAPAYAPMRVSARPKTPLEILIDDLRRARPENSAAVDIMSPEIAIDGASILLNYQALLPDVDGFAVVIDGNPRPLAAVFHLAPEVLPEMRLLVRLAQSSNIAVIARSKGKFYRNQKFVKVTQGGCGDSFTETESRHREEIQQRYPGAK